MADTKDNLATAGRTRRISEVKLEVKPPSSSEENVDEIPGTKQINLHFVPTYFFVNNNGKYGISSR